MIKKFFSPALLVLMSTWALAQNNDMLKQRPLDPVRGHYQQLSSIDSKPVSAYAFLDTLKFLYDPESAARRLGLEPVFLKYVAIDDFKIPDPPANSSAQTRAELNYLLQLQQHRNAEDERSALHKAGIYYRLNLQPSDSSYSQYRRNLFFIGRSIGTWFNPENLPETAELMARVWQDASHFIWSYKYHYLRVRPYVLEPALNNLEETNWAAYPSGHAANSYINAYIYAALAPEFQDIFLKDAYDMAHSREIIGVHFPSDSEASRIFARQFVNKLFANAQFKEAFKKIQQEWTAKAKETFECPTIAPVIRGEKTAGCAKVCEN